jgi:hypothetical protein
MMIPTIHANGDSRETLYDQCSKALNAVRDAVEALQEMTPNGRNYYPQGPEAIGDAMSDHWYRRTRLLNVQKELELMLEGIADA